MITSSDTQPCWEGTGNKVGAVSHMLHWRVLKFREIKWLSKSHTMTNVPISQILLHLIFCGWDLMPLRRSLCLKQSSNSPSTIFLYTSWSKIQASSEKNPSERPQDSNSVHPPQTLHTVNCVTTAFLMPRSSCWVASGLFGCQFSSEPRTF